jgi:hypothetical protein
MVGHGLGFGPIGEISNGLLMMINDFFIKIYILVFFFGKDILLLFVSEVKEKMFYYLRFLMRKFN